jgi:hypothetical protein
MPIQRLKKIVVDAQSVIRELESAPVRRDIDIAVEHKGTIELIHAVIRTRGDSANGQWDQLENIYCCSDHCPRCPHGPFWFRYCRNKRKNTVAIKFVAFPALPEGTLERMRSTAKIGVPYVLSFNPQENRKGIDHFV